MPGNQAATPNNMVFVPPGHTYQGTGGFIYTNNHDFNITLNIGSSTVGTVIPTPLPPEPPPPAPGVFTYTSGFSTPSVAPSWDSYDSTVSQMLYGDSPSKTSKVKDMKDVEQFYNKKLGQVIGFKNGQVSGDIGLEIECEGINLFRTPFKFWTCHEDGSLRSNGPHAPAEYVLKQPVKVEKVREALEYLREKLKEADSKVINSNRCSVHVHVNCQKMTVRELYCYLCMYGIFEELLIEWSSPERAGNLFCQRAKDSDFYIHMLESVLKTGSFKLWKEEYRYSACNVASIPKFGSLEFRSMRGTIDVDLIELWVNLLVHLKTVALSYDSPVVMVEDFINLGPLPFFKKVFKGTKYHELFEHIPGLSGKLWDGLRMMRDVAYACEWKAPIVKKKDEQEEPLKIRYRRGDTFPFMGREYIVYAKDYGRWHMQDGLNEPMYDYEVPDGSVLYYINPTNYLNGNWMKLDVREGDIEYCPESVNQPGDEPEEDYYDEEESRYDEDGNRVE